ncbi:MAG TPA: dehydrogenase E1 component subunit alpha/beta [Longimicrobiales bacterium]|nr:dehydrogenase E1 component subunit alpha/beta [Longimicrobiales bacterium]
MATRESRAKKGGGSDGKKGSSKRSRESSGNGRVKADALGTETLVGLYRTMFAARRTDDREIQLKRQNKIFFQISGAGHEAIQVAIAHHLRPGKDWFYLYYRDRALSQALGMTPYEHLLQAVGAESDPSSGGRQMPSHWGHRELRIVSTSSPTGTQYLQGVGTAEGAWRAGQLEDMRDAIEAFEVDEVVLVTTGEGQTSEGEFWEALNTATNLKLPVVFLVEDNGYAISVPVEVNTPGGKISEVVKGFPGLYIEEVDGCDVLASIDAAGRAVDYCRQRKGPALLHAHVIRPYSHSMSDDERMYRTAKERERDAVRDPLVTYRKWLIDEGHASEEEVAALEAEVNAALQEATDRALEQPQPAPETALKHLYSEEVDPTSSEFDTEGSPAFEGDETTMVDLLNACMRDEMARDPRIVLFGEDVADASREDALDECKGKGGVFKVTWGLQQKYGGVRVFNSPLAEANIVGRAIGMAVRGLKPVVEIQFFDYIWPAFMQIRNELATMRYRSGGNWKSPVVIRVTYGGYLKGGAIYHSQTGETLFTHSPGLRVIMPSNAVDANGLLRTAIRADDPVIFLEHKHLYRQVYNKGRYPGPDFMIPFGKAKVVREGADLTVVTCGALVKRSLDAARMAEDQEGISVEVIDLRSLSPLDMDTIVASVKKTNKVIVAYEDSLSWGIGSEIAARVADETFEWLDGPVKRVASLDTWVAYAPQLEAAILPDVEDVLKAVRELAAY